MTASHLDDSPVTYRPTYPTRRLVARAKPAGDTWQGPWHNTPTDTNLAGASSLLGWHTAGRVRVEAQIVDNAAVPIASGATGSADWTPDATNSLNPGDHRFHRTCF